MKVQAFSNKIFDTKFIWPPRLIGKTSAFHQGGARVQIQANPLYLKLGLSLVSIISGTFRLSGTFRKIISR